MDNNKRLELIIERAIKNVKNFDSINNDKITFLNEKSNELKERFNKEKLGKNYIYNLISYLFITRIEWKNYLSVEEKIILFILIVDPSLKMYSIYENSCKIDSIKKQIIEEFDIYIPGLANLERKYIEKFKDIDKFRFDYQETKKLELN